MFESAAGRQAPQEMYDRETVAIVVDAALDLLKGRIKMDDMTGEEKQAMLSFLTDAAQQAIGLVNSQGKEVKEVTVNRLAKLVVFAYQTVEDSKSKTFEDDLSKMKIVE